MEQFSLIVWCIPCLLFLSFIVLITIGKTGYTAKLSVGLAGISFILACGVLIERLSMDANEYSYYIDWFVIGSTYYRIGYELMNTTAWFLVVITAIHLMVHIVQYLFAKHDTKNYTYFHFIAAAFTGIILADNVMVFFMLSLFVSVGIYLFALQENIKDKDFVLRKYAYSQLLGYMALLAVVVVLYNSIPNHALEFTVIQSILNGHSEMISTQYDWLISLLLLFAILFISGQFILGKSILNALVDQHALRIIIMLVLKVLLPVYILLRFQMLLRTPDAFQEVMFITGLLIMLWSAVKQWFIKEIPYSFANISNSMLGIVLIASSLKHEVALIMLATIFAMITCFVTIFSVTKQTWISVFLYMISVLCLAGIPPLTSFLMLQWLNSAAATQSIWLLMGTSFTILLYSFTLTSFLYISYKHNHELIKKQTKTATIHYLLVLPLLFVVVLGLGWTIWTKDWTHWLIRKAATPMFTFIPTIISLMTVSIGMFLGWQHAAKWKKERIASFHWYDYERKWSFMFFKFVKGIGVHLTRLFVAIESGWFTFWQIYIPYPWKKAERIVASRIPSSILTIILAWSVAAAIAFILTLLRR